MRSLDGAEAERQGLKMPGDVGRYLNLFCADPLSKRFAQNDGLDPDLISGSDAVRLGPSGETICA
jgi:hypothetical protein